MAVTRIQRVQFKTQSGREIVATKCHPKEELKCLERSESKSRLLFTEK